MLRSIRNEIVGEANEIYNMYNYGLSLLWDESTEHNSSTVPFIIWQLSIRKSQIQNLQKCQVSPTRPYNSPTHSIVLIKIASIIGNTDFHDFKFPVLP